MMKYDDVWVWQLPESTENLGYAADAQKMTLSVCISLAARQRKKRSCWENAANRLISRLLFIW
jgi:hypothetical protein